MSKTTEEVCGEAYQVIASIAGVTGCMEDKSIIRALDYFSKDAKPVSGILPFEIKPTLLFNTNFKVAVKLTELGRKILQDQYNRRQEQAPGVNFGAWDRNIDKDGWYRTELWMLFQEFGEHMGMARPMPFETEIRLYPGSA